MRRVSRQGVKSKGSLHHLVVGKGSSSEMVHPNMEDVTGRCKRLREEGGIHYRSVFVGGMWAWPLPFTWIWSFRINYGWYESRPIPVLDPTDRLKISGVHDSTYKGTYRYRSVTRTGWLFLFLIRATSLLFTCQKGERGASPARTTTASSGNYAEKQPTHKYHTADSSLPTSSWTLRSAYNRIDYSYKGTGIGGCKSGDKHFFAHFLTSFLC